jgi:hypothetical protein
MVPPLAQPYHWWTTVEWTVYLGPTYIHIACPSVKNNKTLFLVLEKGQEEARQCKGEELLTVQIDSQSGHSFTITLQSSKLPAPRPTFTLAPPSSSIPPGMGSHTNSAPRSAPLSVLSVSTTATATTSTTARLIQVEHGTLLTEIIIFCGGRFHTLPSMVVPPLVGWVGSWRMCSQLSSGRLCISHGGMYAYGDRLHVPLSLDTHPGDPMRGW